MNFAGVRLDEGLVLAQILLRHPRRSEPFLEMPAHLASIEFRKSSCDRFNGFRFPRHDKAGYAVVDDLRHGAGLEGNDRRAAGHSLDHDEAERFEPINGKQQRRGVREKLPLRFIIDLAGELDLLPVDLWLELFLEIAS